jgi:hypothetical protein
MANTNDALNPPSPPNRVFYSTGRMLGVEDFQAEQDYHRGRLARILLQLFGTGTVSGLNVTLGNDPGDSSLEIQVSPGMAIDRVGRVIEVPRQVCIRVKNWYAQVDPSILNMALHGANVVVDVFATFVPCTRGATPCFASQDDYDATDAFSPNRWLDSFSMQLLPRTDITDATQKLPKDPWFTGARTTTAAAVTAGNNVSVPVASSSGLSVGQQMLIDTGANQEQFNVTTVPDATHIVADTLGRGHASGSSVRSQVKQGLLAGTTGAAALSPFGSGPAGVEYPLGFDTTSVFLARILIPATAGGAAQPPTANFDQIKPPDNTQRLFIVPSAVVAAWVGLTSGTEGS